MPYIASKADYANGQIMVRAFTDTKRLHRFVKENKLEKPDGSYQILTIPTKGIVDYLEKFISQGVFGIWFNSDLESKGFSVPLAKLREIKAYLDNLNPPKASASETIQKQESPMTNYTPTDYQSNAKSKYKNIDGRTIKLPSQSIKVQYKRLQDVLLAFLFVLFGGISLLLLFGSKFRMANLLIAFFCLSILFVISFLALRAKRKAARAFDASGITRGDGRHFSWQEFQGVVRRTARNRLGREYIWRFELVFADGEKAWIIPQRIKNFQEVFAFIESLPAAIIKEV
jgi:hypothetical protein